MKLTRTNFDGVNKDLGKGTGIGFDTFTVYSPKLSSGTNGLGIPAFGENPEIDLTTDVILNGDPFVASGLIFDLKTNDTACRLNLIPLQITLT